MKKYKISEILKIFGIARSTIYNWEKAGKLTLVKEDKKTYVILGDELNSEMLKTSDLKDYAIEQNINFYKSRFVKSEEKVKELQIKLDEKLNEIDELKKELESLKKSDKKMDTDILHKNVADINIKIEKMEAKFDKILENIEKSNNGFFKKIFNL